MLMDKLIFDKYKYNIKQITNKLLMKNNIRTVLSDLYIYILFLALYLNQLVIIRNKLNYLML